MRESAVDAMLGGNAKNDAAVVMVLMLMQGAGDAGAVAAALDTAVAVVC